MLNLLIAIMGDSYDKVQENAFLEYRRELARVIVEIEIMMTKKERRRRDYFPRWLHVLQPTTTGGARQRDRWIGRIREIKESVEVQVMSLQLKMREQFGSQLRKQQREMEESLNELKEQMHEVKDLLRSGGGVSVGKRAHHTGGVSILQQRRPSVIMREEQTAFAAREAADEEVRQRQQAAIAAKKSRQSVKRKKSEADDDLTDE